MFEKKYFLATFYQDVTNVNFKVANVYYVDWQNKHFSWTNKKIHDIKNKDTHSLLFWKNRLQHFLVALVMTFLLFVVGLFIAHPTAYLYRIQSVQEERKYILF